MRILILNDLHLGESSESTTNPGIVRQANTEAAQALKEVVGKLKSQPFDMVVQMGDLVRDVGIEEIEVANITIGLELLKELPFPLIHLLGNHELRALPIEKISKAYQDTKTPPEFFGYQEHDEVQLAWIDYQLEGKSTARITEERVRWLKEMIKPDKPTILFSHFGFLPQNPSGNFYFEKYPKDLCFANGQEVWEQIKDLPIQAVISAHVHWIGYQKSGKTHMCTVPAFSENFASTDPHNNPGIYSILETNGNSLNLKSYSGNFCFANFELQ